MKKHDDGKHIDVKRMRDGHSYADHDWSNRTGQSFRKRGDDGNFALGEHGKEVLKGRKK
jgi:hypothetical protein